MSKMDFENEFDPKIGEKSTETQVTSDEVQIEYFLVVVITVLAFLHTSSNRWLNFVSKTEPVTGRLISDFCFNSLQFVTLSCPSGREEDTIKEEIADLKQELGTIDQVDEFSRFSKTERKINKAREKLVLYNNARTVASMQARSAFVTVWRVIAVRVCLRFDNDVCLHFSRLFQGLIALMLMWHYSQTPVMVFRNKELWYPIGWLFALPTGVVGAVGIPFFTMAVRTFLSNCQKLTKS